MKSLTGIGFVARAAQGGEIHGESQMSSSKYFTSKNVALFLATAKIIQ